MRFDPPYPQELNLGSTADLYDRVEAVACEIHRDERTIKDCLIDALEKGQTVFALKLLKAWRTPNARWQPKTLTSSSGPRFR